MVLFDFARQSLSPSFAIYITISFTKSQPPRLGKNKIPRQPFSHQGITQEETMLYCSSGVIAGKGTERHYPLLIKAQPPSFILSFQVYISRILRLSVLCHKTKRKHTQQIYHRVLPRLRLPNTQTDLPSGDCSE